MTQPQFTHDCERCVFLGQFQDKYSQPIDLYACPPNGARRWIELVERWGNEGEEYRSESIKDHYYSLISIYQKCQP